MSRKDEVKGGSKNPSEKFLKWSSDNKCLTYYDKEKKENLLVQLPFRFVWLKEMAVIKGWNDASESAIISNEVRFISKEEIEVKSFKGGLIAKGLYKDIKETVVNAGGKYHSSIYCMLEDGSLANISLKGSAIKAWGDFSQKSRNLLPDIWIEIDGATEGKKGSITYSMPNFKFDGTLSSNDGDCADIHYDTVEAFVNGISPRVEAATEEIDDCPI